MKDYCFSIYLYIKNRQQRCHGDITFLVRMLCIHLQVLAWQSFDRPKCFILSNVIPTICHRGVLFVCSVWLLVSPQPSRQAVALASTNLHWVGTKQQRPPQSGQQQLDLSPLYTCIQVLDKYMFSTTVQPEMQCMYSTCAVCLFQLYLLSLCFLVVLSYTSLSPKIKLFALFFTERKPECVPHTKNPRWCDKGQWYKTVWLQGTQWLLLWLDLKAILFLSHSKHVEGGNKGIHL